MTRKELTYALITPARNEAELIGATIDSVIAQTKRPRRWIIVDDGSSDGTDDVVMPYVKRHDWIELIRMPERRDRQFAAKAHAFNNGYARLTQMSFDIVGNLDADITVPPDYFEFLLARFDANPRLGVAGTPYVEDAERPEAHSYAHRDANLAHVSGACQLFRKRCFEEVGGYLPVKGGAIDWIAVTTARMKGWTTRTYLDRVCLHHRRIGTAESNTLQARFHYGRKAWYVGGHPVWETMRGVFDMRSRPYVVGGLSFIAGYAWAAAMRTPRVVSPELIAFHRGEQMSRFRRLLQPGSAR